MESHYNKKQFDYEPVFKCLLAIILSIALAVISALCYPEAEAQEQSRQPPSEELVDMPWQQDNQVVPTRTHDLGMFGNAIANHREKISDTYRVFP